MLKLKSDVKVAGMRPELMLALSVAESVYATKGYDLTVTSICDGTHSRTSLHYCGCAADLRTRDIAPDHHKPLADEIQAALGSDYDVVLEGDHIHVEFQPKGPHQVAGRTA